MTYARPTRPEQLLELQHSMTTALVKLSDKYQPEYGEWNCSVHRPTNTFSTPHDIDPNDWIALNYGGTIAGSLIWVTADMVDLLEAAWKSIPADTELHESFIAFPEAVAFMEKPLYSLDVLTWRPAEALEGFHGMNTTSFDLSQSLSLPINILDYWGWGQPVTDTDLLLLTEEARKAPEEVQHRNRTMSRFQRQVFVALNLLLTQPGITATHEAPISRPFRKRAERRNQKAQIRLVHLRHAGGGSHAGNGHHLTKRFIVRGHWRNQTWGPRGSLRRPTWISPHLKGPEGAPLDTRPTVFVANASPDEVAS